MRGCGLPDPEDRRHGTGTGYVSCKCRCTLCREYNANYARKLRARDPEKFLHYERERAKSIARQKYRKEYSKKNAELIKIKSRTFRLENLEVYRAASARRRSKLTENLSKEDIVLAVAYRKAIAKDLCYYCGLPGEQDDHFFPVALGGRDLWYNLVRSCAVCNHSKSAHCGTWFLLRS